MTRLPKILHLVDDTTAGGVMRVLDFLRLDPVLGETAQHEVMPVKRGALVMHLAQADVIVSHLAVSWRSLPSLIALRLRCIKTPLIHVEHSYTDAFVAHKVAHKARFKLLLKLSYALFDRVVCVSNGQANWMVSNRLAHPDSLSTIQSCVDLCAFRALPPPDHPPRVFAAIGRLDEQKGFDTLITAFRLCPLQTVQLHIIGDGAEKETLRALAAGDPRISFKGFQQDTAAALADVDIVVMPSRWEAYGLVAIEALAAGRRLICNDIDGLKDHAQLGAVLVDTTNVVALSTLITQETLAPASDNPQSLARTTQQLENRFRESWRYMLSLVVTCPAENSAVQEWSGPWRGA